MVIKNPKGWNKFFVNTYIEKEVLIDKCYFCDGPCDYARAVWTLKTYGCKIVVIPVCKWCLNTLPDFRL